MKPAVKRCVIAASILLFMSDLSDGTVVPTEAVFARELGASLTFIGFMSTCQLAAVIPMGMIAGPLSDRRGLKRLIITLGLALSAIRGLMYFAAMNPIHMLAGKIMFGVASGSLYFVAFAYVLSETSGHERGMAFGISATAMGLGFVLGPIIGGNVANIWGYRSSYLLSSVIAALGMPIAMTCVKDTSKVDSETGQKLSIKRRSFTRTLIEGLKSWVQNFKVIIRNKDILTVSISSIFNSLDMDTVFSFASIHAKSVGLNAAEIGSAFSVRGLGSTLIRIPSGKLTSRVGARRMIAAFLFIQSIALFFISKSDAYMILAIFLTLEGICWSVNYVSIQVHIVEASGDSKGTALGASQTLGKICGPTLMVIMGTVADTWGVANVFMLCAALCIVGGLFTLFGPRTPLL